MINGVIIKKLDKFEDERGALIEIWRSDGSNYKPKMCYVSVTKPGQVRGPHEHIKQTDYFIFIGPGNLEIYLWDKREGSNTNGEHIKIKVGADNPSLVLVPPGVVHGYKCVSEEAGYSINLPDKLYKGKGKKEEIDEIRWEEDKKSPYKIS